MNVIALTHNITDERSEFLENTPIDDIKLKNIKPKRIVSWGTYEDYSELDRLCSKLNIEFITIFPMLV
ncbi:MULTISPECIES: hypothetical protein [Staphylococcaceae]|uniref:hypothetical protein n=1 Tax=Staphylococcaceae TaxID=90964 RepID=UPI0021D3EB3D|nr:hypothetical protein [Mammaliicoccus sciuri]UXV32214.1 hypothetical protein MUA60_15165 [Mammaliicoccus sciuri]